LAAKNELIRFSGQWVKGQGHSETKYGDIHVITLGGIFSPVCRMHGRAFV